MGGTVWTVAAIEDISGDGKMDVVVGLGDLAGDGWVHAIRSSDATTVWAFPAQVGGIVTEVHVIGDENSDGVDDILAAGVMYDYFVLDGATGAFLWSRPSPHKAFATSGIPDLTGDGRDDVIGGSGHSVNRVWVMEGTAGDTLWALPLGGPVETVHFLKSIDADPSSEVLVGTRSGEILCLAGGETLTDVPADTPAPAAGAFALQVYPNPFNPTTTVAFELPQDGRTSLAIFDVQGRRVRTLLNGAARAGTYRVTWDGCEERGTPAAPGVYFARLDSDGRVCTRKMVLAE